MTPFSRRSFLQIALLCSLLVSLSACSQQQQAASTAAKSKVLPWTTSDNPHSEGVRSIAYSKDGAMLASGGGNLIKTWDTGSGRNTATFDLKAPAVRLAVSERVLAATSQEQNIDFWDWHRKEKLGTVEKKEEKYYNLIALSPDSKTIAAANLDNSISILDVDTGAESCGWQAGPKEVTGIALSPDGKKLATGTDTIRIWDVKSGKKLSTLDGHAGNVTALAFSPDGKTLASGSIDTTVRLWDVESGAERVKLQGHTDKVTSVSFNPEGKSLASGSEDATVKLWSVDSGNCINTISTKVKVLSVEFNPRDGKTLATGRGDGMIEIWNVGGDDVHQAGDTDSRRILTVHGTDQLKERPAEK
jgi:WD40 repeat protein